MIPSINGTRHFCPGQFTLSSPVFCDGKETFFRVLENRLSQSEVCPNIQFIFSASNARCSIRLLSDETLDDEAYRLELSSARALIFSSTEAGWIWGLTTLFSLLREGKGSCPCQIISDAPLYRHRGFHLDCSRHFFSADTVRLMIELASRAKLNRMHWHISDDQGYRLESKCFPKLNTVASWRTEPDKSVYGGYYTMEEVKEIVSFAKERGIEIIPEIDMPGHVSAIIAAYPSLSCSGEPLEVPFMPGIHKRIFCGGNPDVLDFIFRLLDEVAPLFPYPYFHIGGDEAPKDEWKTCPLCQAKIKALGIHNEEDLQAHFSSVIADHLKTLGKTAICWNDALKASRLPETICVQYWDEEGENPNYCERDLTRCDRDWIYSFTPAFYLDFMPSLTPMRKTYHFSPVLRGGCSLPQDHLLGIECTLWSEQFSTQAELIARAFPRMYAVAERGWAPKGDYKEFKSRCENEINTLASEGISLPPVSEGDPSKETQKQLILAQWGPAIRQAKNAGMEAMVPVICGLIRSKLLDQFPPRELDAFMKQLEGEQ